MIIVGQLRQLDVDKQEGRVRGTHSSGAKEAVFKYNQASSAKIKRAFVQDLTVVMEINDQGWCDMIREVIPIEVDNG